MVADRPLAPRVPLSAGRRPRVAAGTATKLPLRCASPRHVNNGGADLRCRLSVLGAVFFFVVSPGPARACTDYNAQLHVLSELTTSGYPGSMFASASDSRLYVADYSDLVILDASDPDAPVTLGSVPLNGTTRAVAVSGSYAYVASGASVHVVDVTNPAAPAVAATLGTGSAVDLVLIGDRLVVADVFAGFLVVSVTDPLSPTIVDTLPGAPTLGQTVVTDGTLAYCADGSSLTVIDPAGTPHVVSNTPLPNNTLTLAYDSGRVYAMANEDNGYLAIALYLGVIDVSNPVAPVAAPFHFLGISGIDGCIAVHDSHAYVSDALQVPPRLTAYDIAADPSDYDAWTAVGTLDLVSPSHMIFLNGCLVGSDAVQVRMIDVTPPVSLAPLGAVSVPAGTSDLEIAGDVAYNASSSGLDVVDLSVPSAPTVLGSLDTDDTHVAYAAVGDVLYAATDVALRVLDVTDPAAPWERGSVALVCNDVAILGTMAIVAGPTGLHVVDVSDPDHPALLGTRTGDFREVSIYQDRAYATRWIDASHQGLEVIDILTNPSSPTRLAGAALVTGVSTLACESLEISGHHAYVEGRDASGLSAVLVFDLDVATPQTPPVLVGGVPYSTGSAVYDITDLDASDGLLYVQSGLRFEVLSLENPAAPTVWATNQSPSFGTGILAVDGSLLCIRSGNDVQVWPAQCAPAAVGAPVVAGRGPSALRVHPNPATGAATIAYSIDAPAAGRLDVFDVTGRKVRTLAAGRLERAGRLAWDGRGADGAAVPAGVYFVRLKTADRSEASKLVLLR